MITFHSMILHAERLPPVPDLISAAGAEGVDIRFEEGFDFRKNPKNQAGRVAVTLNGRQGEVGYAIDPLWLLIDDHEVSPEAAAYGDSLVTVGVTAGFEPLAAAVEHYFARNFDAYGWHDDGLVAPNQLATDAAQVLTAAKEQDQSDA